jgi:tripartite-type tricarboxylate transporter receptor subunit TctC
LTLILRALSVAVVLCAASAGATAQTYPTRPIRWVVPFAAGGGADVIGRPVAIAVGELLGQPVVYDNRGGGNGMIAGEIVARAAPDGYTALVSGPAILTANPHLYKKMPFDVEKDFTHITKIATAPNVLGAFPGFAPKSVPEVIDYAKANPGKVNWASSGIGTGGHIAVELFMMRTAAKVTHISYKGAGPALVSLMSGDVHLLIAVPGVFLPHIKTGRVRALAVGSLQRLPVLPGIPTLDESGLSGMQSGSWYGLTVPAGTPQNAIKVLHGAVGKVLANTELRARLTANGAIPSGNSPEQMAAEVRAESASWARVIKQAGIRLD